MPLGLVSTHSLMITHSLPRVNPCGPVSHSFIDVRSAGVRPHRVVEWKLCNFRWILQFAMGTKTWFRPFLNRQQQQQQQQVNCNAVINCQPDMSNQSKFLNANHKQFLFFLSPDSCQCCQPFPLCCSVSDSFTVRAGTHPHTYMYVDTISLFKPSELPP